MDLETPIAVTPQISDKANKKIQWYDRIMVSSINSIYPLVSDSRTL